MVNSCKILDHDYCLLAHNMIFSIVNWWVVKYQHVMRLEIRIRILRTHSMQRINVVQRRPNFGDAYQLIPSKTDKTLLLTTDEFCLSEYFLQV